MSAFPGMSAELYGAWQGLKAGTVPPETKFTTTRASLWHRKNVGTALSGSYNFFNVASAPFTTNMPQAGSLPNERAMWINTIRVHVARGYEYDGTAAADVLPNQTDADPLAAANDLDLLLSYGHFTLKINGRTYVDMFGLYNFPAGGGVYVDGVAATTASTVTYIDVHPNNGFPDARNMYVHPVPIPLPPGQNIECTIGYNIAPTLKDTYVVTVNLDGMMIYPANN